MIQSWQRIVKACESPVACLFMRKQLPSSVAWRISGRLLVDAVRFWSLACRSRSQLAAENLALYAERRVRSRRTDDATRITLVVPARLIDWRAALSIVKPETLIRWHRKGFGLFGGGSPSRAAARHCLPMCNI